MNKIQMAAVVVLSQGLWACAGTADKPSQPDSGAQQTASSASDRSGESRASVTLKSLRSSGFTVWGRSNTNTDTRHWLTMKKGNEIYVCDRTVAQGGSNNCAKLNWRSSPNPLSLLQSGFRFAGQTVQKSGSNQGRSAITLHFESTRKSQYVRCDFATVNGGQTRCLTGRL